MLGEVENAGFDKIVLREVIGKVEISTRGEGEVDVKIT